MASVGMVVWARPASFDARPSMSIFRSAPREGINRKITAHSSAAVPSLFCRLSSYGAVEGYGRFCPCYAIRGVLPLFCRSTRCGAAASLPLFCRGSATSVFAVARFFLRSLFFLLFRRSRRRDPAHQPGTRHRYPPAPRPRPVHTPPAMQQSARNTEYALDAGKTHAVCRRAVERAASTPQRKPGGGGRARRQERSVRGWMHARGTQTVEWERWHWRYWP